MDVGSLNFTLDFLSSFQNCDNSSIRRRDGTYGRFNVRAIAVTQKDDITHFSFKASGYV